jgi:hypothetical protein
MGGPFGYDDNDYVDEDYTDDWLDHPSSTSQLSFTTGPPSSITGSGSGSGIVPSSQTLSSGSSSSSSLSSLPLTKQLHQSLNDEEEVLENPHYVDSAHSISRTKGSAMSASPSISSKQPQSSSKTVIAVAVTKETGVTSSTSTSSSSSTTSSSSFSGSVSEFLASMNEQVRLFDRRWSSSSIERSESEMNELMFKHSRGNYALFITLRHHYRRRRQRMANEEATSIGRTKRAVILTITDQFHLSSTEYQSAFDAFEREYQLNRRDRFYNGTYPSASITSEIMASSVGGKKLNTQMNLKNSSKAAATSVITHTKHSKVSAKIHEPVKRAEPSTTVASASSTPIKETEMERQERLKRSANLAADTKREAELRRREMEQRQHLMIQRELRQLQQPVISHVDVHPLNIDGQPVAVLPPSAMHAMNMHPLRRHTRNNTNNSLTNNNSNTRAAAATDDIHNNNNNNNNNNNAIMFAAPINEKKALSSAASAYLSSMMAMPSPTSTSRATLMTTSENRPCTQSPFVSSSILPSSNGSRNLMLSLSIPPLLSNESANSNGNNGSSSPLQVTPSTPSPTCLTPSLFSFSLIADAVNDHLNSPSFDVPSSSSSSPSSPSLPSSSSSPTPNGRGQKRLNNLTNSDTNNVSCVTESPASTARSTSRHVTRTVRRKRRRLTGVSIDDESDEPAK